MSTLRQQAIFEIDSRSEITRIVDKNKMKNYGANCFGDTQMRETLPKDIYKTMKKIIKKGGKLDMNIANTVAHAMKEWAIEKGVTHFCHWFQPLTGLTAEKHDAFIEVDNDGFAVERFKASQLVQGEPDASSFPSGGTRSTFEARGYTAWDPTSPAFIMESPRGGILCIPSVFISYNGEALDKKTPLLRSIETINKSALKVLKLFNNKTATRVIVTIGTEQEYFLVDRAFYKLRPDLILTGRTLIGAMPAKGQELDDHYFGTIKERVLAYMEDVETELYKLGIPAKTRHNEVAPNQYELAPIYDEANVGADRNQITMEIFKKVAVRHNLALLLHEKPFANINGSGKHNNWSLEDSDGNNLLDPGETPEENLQFLVFLVATLRAVHNYGGLLRASVASAGNDHRLGGHEAPPAIMSVFLGEMLNNVLNAIKDGKDLVTNGDSLLDIGIAKLPPIIQHNTDRNRTSPFAFTGSKFEFRAVGSAESVSFPNSVLNAGVSESLDLIVKDIQELMNTGKDIKKSTLKVLQKYIIETEAVRFEGNNYSDDWKNEAANRGLTILKNAGYALDAIVAPKNLKMMVEQNVYKKSELELVHQAKLIKYTSSLEIEVKTFIDLAKTRVIPAAIEYQTSLVKSVTGLRDVADLFEDNSLHGYEELLKKVVKNVIKINEGETKFIELLNEANAIDNLSSKAKYYADNIVPALESVRIYVDELESIIPDEIWPLPKYSEMLFML